MQWEYVRKNGCGIVRLVDDVTINVDINELPAAVQHILGQGASTIAVSFTPNSYLSSRSISILVSCCELVVKSGGRFAVVSPNKEMLSVLTTIGLECRIGVYHTEEQVGT